MHDANIRQRLTVITVAIKRKYFVVYLLNNRTEIEYVLCWTKWNECTAQHSVDKTKKRTRDTFRMTSTSSGKRFVQMHHIFSMQRQHSRSTFRSTRTCLRRRQEICTILTLTNWQRCLTEAKTICCCCCCYLVFSLLFLFSMKTKIRITALGRWFDYYSSFFFFLFDCDVIRNKCWKNV